MNATRGGEYGGKGFRDTYGVKESMVGYSRCYILRAITNE